MRIATNSSKIDISNEDQTSNLANFFAKYLTNGDVILLYGEIGVGKTTFVKYLINAIQKKKKDYLTEVTSPTFNIMNEYQVKNINISHFDLFRIEKTIDLNNIGLFNESRRHICRFIFINGEISLRFFYREEKE